MDSTGGLKVQALSALLRSTAPDSQQLEDAADLLSWKIPSTDEILASNLDVHPLAWSPSGDRLLKWLLSKLCKQDVSPTSLSRDASAYTLLFVLIISSPEAVVLRHLQYVDLPETLCASLIYARQELQRLKISDPSQTGKGKQRSQKRKPLHYDNQTVDARKKHCFAILFSVCRLFDALLHRTRFCTHADVHIEIVKNVLKISVERAALIVQAGLQCILEEINHRSWISEYPIASYIIRPLLAVWTSAKSPSKTEDRLYNARTFAQYCLFPSLLLQRNRSDLHLDALIKQCCLASLIQAVNSDEERRSSIASLLCKLEDANQPPQQLLDGNKEESQLSSLLECVPLLVELAGQVASAKLPAKKDAFDPWFEELFLHIVAYTGIEIDSTSSALLHANQYAFVADTLAAYRNIDRNPGREVLTKLLLKCTVQELPSFSEQPWRLLSLIVGLQPDILVQQGDGPENDSFRAHVFSQIECADRAMASTEAAGKDRVDFASKFLLEPLLDALVRQRSILTFIPDWTESIQKCLLSSLIIRNGGSVRMSRRSFWECSSVKCLIKQSISTSVPDDALNGLVYNTEQGIVALSKRSTDMIKFYGQLILLSTLLSARNKPTQNSRGMSLKKQPGNEVQRSSVYQTLEEHYLKHPENESNVLVLDLMQQLHCVAAYELGLDGWIPSETFSHALCQMVEDSLSKNQNPGYYECAFSAWTMLNHWLCVLPSNFCLNLEKAILKRTWPLIAQRLEELWSEEMRTMANGSHDSGLTARKAGLDVCNPTDYLYDCLQEAISTGSWVVKPPDQSTAHEVVHNLYICAFFSRRGWFRKEQPETKRIDQEMAPTRSWRMLWSRLIRSTAYSESHDFWQVIQQSLVKTFVDIDTRLVKAVPSKIELYDFCVCELQSVNVRSLSTSDRGRVINRITDQLASTAVSASSVSSSLHLLRRFTSVPTKAASLIANSEAVWLLAGNLNQDNIGFGDVESLRSIANNIITYWTMDKSSHLLMVAFIQYMNQKIERHVQQDMMIGEAVVISSAISVLEGARTHIHLLEPAARLGFLKCQIQDLFALDFEITGPSTTMFALLENITSLPRSTLAAFDWQQPAVTLQRTKQLSNETEISIETYLRKLDNHLFRILSEMSSNWEEGDVAVLCWSRSKKLLILISGNSEDPKQFDGSEIAYLSFGADQRRMRELLSGFEDISAGGKARVLDFVAKNCGDRSLISGTGYVQCLVSYPIRQKDRETELLSSLHKVFDTSFAEVERLSGLSSHYLKIMGAILNHNPWSTTQEHVDRTLAMVTSLTSQSCRMPDFKTSGQSLPIVDLIRLLGVIFQNHRQKVGGRWHLVIHALKGILRCLFISNLNLASREAIPHPQWIHNTGSTQPTSRDVHAFSRLLCAICDPTYKVLKSNNSNSRDHQLLNDTTKAARAVSGQHMQHMIAEFCSLQLKGKIVDSDAIKPGLYAIFDAMSQDVKRSLNESLDVQSRVMFKNLYDEWIRFGKWNG